MYHHNKRPDKTESRISAVARATHLLPGLLLILCLAQAQLKSVLLFAECSLDAGLSRSGASLISGKGFRVETRAQFWPPFPEKPELLTAVASSYVESTEIYSLLHGRAMIEQRLQAGTSRRYYISKGEDQLVRVVASADPGAARTKCEQIDRRHLMGDLFELFEGNDKLAENWLMHTADGLPDFFIGMARLLVVFEANRGKMKTVHDMQRVREFQAQRYDLEFKLGGMDVTLTAYTARNLFSRVESELPIRIWLKTKKQGLMMVDYYLVEPIPDQAQISNLNYHLDPTTVELGLGCSDLPSREQSFSTFLEIFSMNFEVIRSPALANNLPKREEFVAYDGRQQAFRRDTLALSSPTSTTIYDTKRGLKFNFKQSPGAVRRAIFSEEHLRQQGSDCIMAPAWLGTQRTFMPFERFVKMGTGVVRGVDVTIFEHVSDTPPEVFSPTAKYLSLNNEGQIQSRSVKVLENSAKTRSRFSVVYYFASAPLNEKVPYGSLIRVDLMRGGRLLEQINVYNFAWQLTDAPNGDKQEHLFTVPISCGRDFASTSTSLNMELEFQTATSSRINEQEARNLFDSVPLRTKALLRSLSEQAADFATTQVVDIKSRLRNGRSSSDKFKLYASVKLALGHLSGVIYQPVFAARVMVHNTRWQDSNVRSYEECFYAAARQFGRGQVLFAFIEGTCFIDSNPLYEISRREGGTENIIFTYSNVFRISNSPDIGYMAMHVTRLDLAEIDPLSPQQISTHIYDSLINRRLVMPIADITHPQFLFESLMFKIETVDFAEIASSRNDQNGPLKGLALINGKILQASGLEEVDYQSCHAACQSDLSCKSYSVCSRGLTVECRISDLNFDDANLWRQLELKRNQLDFSKGRQLSLELDVEDSDSGDHPAEGQQPPRKKYVDLLVDRRCQIYRKRASDMFRELLRTITPLRSEALLEVDSKEECAELCLRNNIDYFVRHQNFSLTMMKSSDATTIKKFHSKNLKRWCATFRYLDQRTSSAINSKQELAKLEQFQKEGLCLLSRPRGSPLKGRRRQADATEGQSTPMIQMEVYEFNYVNLYEIRRNIMMLPHTGESTGVGTITNERMVARLNSPEECARACFTQTTELIPYCKSFEFVRAEVQTSKTSGGSSESSIVSKCFFNSMSLSDTIEAGLYDKIVTNQTNPSIVSLFHYEPHKSYLINDALMRRLTEVELNLSPSGPRNNSFVVLSITVVALISGLVLGVYIKDPLRQCLAVWKSAESVKRQRFSSESNNEDGLENL